MTAILNGILNPKNYSNKRWRTGKFEQFIKVVLLLISAISVATTVAIVSVMIFEAALFFQNVSVVEFLTETRWTPLYASKHFGILPLLTGTFLVATGAMIIALPLGLLSAIYLSEYAPDSVRKIIKPVLEVLAGIPTVVYGYFALLFISPILQSVSDNVKVFNAASAAIVMGIMILPMVSSLSEDAMRAVPRSLREGAYALGATKLEVSLRIVTPAAISGIVASFILAISRAIGETMIVTVAAGQNPTFTFNPFIPIETMTAYIVQISMGDTPTGSIEFQTIFAVGISLFIITLTLNMVSQYIVRKFRNVYE
jgi:phosphate transport system permease protein